MAKDRNGNVPKENLFQRKERYLVSGVLNEYMSPVIIKKKKKRVYIGVFRPKI